MSFSALLYIYQFQTFLTGCQFPIYIFGWHFPSISNQAIISCDNLIYFNLGIASYKILYQVCDRHRFVLYNFLSYKFWNNGFGSMLIIRLLYLLCSF